MLYYPLFTLFFLINNNIWNNFILSFLTNILLNYSYLLFITFLIHYYFFNKFLIWSYFIYSLLLKYQFTTLIALNNIMFIYHPTFLYISVICLCYCNFFEKIKIKCLWLVILWISFLLGGVWASQEFNWGGWWNWDSLEMGILFIIFMYVSILHIYFSTQFRFYWNICIIIFILTYWFLNKYGLTISIHSFIKNNSILFYKWTLIFIAYTPISTITCINIYLLTFLIYPIKSIFFLKLLTLTSLWLFFKNYFFFKKLKLNIFHIILKWHVYIMCIINYNNIINYLYTITNLNIYFTSFTNIFFLNLYVDNINSINSLKKDFFFFKYQNSLYYSLFTTLQLSNYFSVLKWYLLI